MVLKIYLLLAMRYKGNERERPSLSCSFWMGAVSFNSYSEEESLPRR